MSNGDTVLKQVYSSFSQRLSFDDFQNKINLLNKWNFVRAVLLYQQAVKCEKCNPNVAIGLLCSCADAMQLGKNPSIRFKEFYERFCPTNLRDSPIEYYPKGKIPKKTTPFDKTLRYIYKQFRCRYFHEGIGRLTPAPDGFDFLCDQIENEKDVYLVDMVKIAEWFRKITFESLFVMLTKYPIPSLRGVFDLED